MDKWQEIFNALTAADIDTYPPGGHIGTCSSPYCVVQACGAAVPSGTRLIASRSYRIFMVVPIEEPAAMGQLAGQVRNALQPMVDSGTLQLDTPTSAMAVDDSFSALITHTEYTCYYSERN